MNDVLIANLSPFLLPLYELEIELGNCVLRVDRNAWSNCPLAVVFRNPLNFKIAMDEVEIPHCVKQWENRDPHYCIEAGWICEHSRHSLSGPLHEKG